jgi:hypothetical protein
MLEGVLEEGGWRWSRALSLLIDECLEREEAAAGSRAPFPVAPARRPERVACATTAP